jgi:succinate-acetate transporter protein
VPSNLSAVHVQPNNQFETVGLLDTEADVSGVSTAANAPQAVEAEGQPSGFCGCCTLAYYKPVLRMFCLPVQHSLVFTALISAQLFNVDSSDVSTRLLASLLPFKETKFFETVGDNADLYGPFWISATLVFVIGAAANLNSWAKTPSDKVIALQRLV